MESIQNQNHTKETFYFALSRMFERASYYGFRALLILYMTGKVLKMDKSQAIGIYAWFTASIVFSQILGAILGDLIIGNKKSILIGATLQALGTFCFCLPFTTGLYLGLSLIVLGNGLYSPNLISNFGKLYFNKTKLLDSGFTIFHFAMNLGSFFGVLLIGYFSNQYSFNVGFILCGILMMFSLLPLIISKEIRIEKIENSKIKPKNRILNIVTAFILVGLFWGFYRMANVQSLDLHFQFHEISASIFLNYFWESFYSISMLLTGLIAIVLWSFFYNSQFYKILLGCIFGALSFGMLLLVPEVPSAQHFKIYLTSLILLAIAEIHIAPVIYSILTKYANPKYLTILISLTFVPTGLFSLLFELFNGTMNENPILGLKFGILGLSLIGIGMMGYFWWNKKRKNERNTSFQS